MNKFDIFYFFFFYNHFTYCYLFHGYLKFCFIAPVSMSYLSLDFFVLWQYSILSLPFCMPLNFLLKLEHLVYDVSLS